MWRRQWHPTPVLLPGKPHGWRSLVGCSPWGRQESDTTERLHFHFLLSHSGEGNGSPLQCSCLENPRDGGAWWPAIYGITQSRTRLKWLSSSSSRLLIAFLPRSKHLLISSLQSPSVVILEPKKLVCHCFLCFPTYLPWNIGTRSLDWFFECWVLSQLFHSPFTFIKRLFSTSSLSAIRAVSSAYLRLLIFLPAILITACASSSLGFHKMYSAYKLNMLLLSHFSRARLCATP